MSKFENACMKVLKEMMVAGSGGVMGNFEETGGDVDPGDTYAPGDARKPYAIGTFKRSGKVNTKAKKRKRKTT